MSEDTTDPRTPEAIRDEMAKTRAALSRKLGALQERLLGTPHPARTGEPNVMVKKAKSGGAAKKPTAAKRKVAAKATPAKKSAARTTTKKKSAASRTLAKGAAAKTTARRKPAVKKAKSPAKKSIGSKGVKTVKEVLGDLAAGAAAGAVTGAAAAAVPHVEQTAARIEHTAETPPAPAPTM